MAFTIYKATAPDGRAYVGCTRNSVESRWRGHAVCDLPFGTIRTGDSISQAIGHFGRTNFKLETLATVESPADAAAVETLMIERHGTLAPGGFNIMRSNYTPTRWKEAA